MAYSEVNGQQWKSVARESEVNSTPLWNASDAGTPLSPNAAIRAASLVLRGIVPNPAQWPVRSVTLFPVGQTPRAIYQVEFNEMKPGVMMEGHPPTLTILVLMNGVAIVPTPSKDDLSIPEVTTPN